MDHKEKLLLLMMGHAPDRNTQAVILQSFIAEYGPLSEDAGVKVKALLHSTVQHDEHVERNKAVPGRAEEIDG